jgi:hypothetical protein
MDRVKLQRTSVFLRLAREPPNRRQLSLVKNLAGQLKPASCRSPITGIPRVRSLRVSCGRRRSGSVLLAGNITRTCRRVVIVYHGLSGVNGASQWLVLGVVVALG